MELSSPLTSRLIYLKIKSKRQKFDIWQNDYIKFDQKIVLSIKERNYDDDGTDPSEDYFRKKKKDYDDDTYFPQEESEPPHY